MYHKQLNNPCMRFYSVVKLCVTLSFICIYISNNQINLASISTQVLFLFPKPFITSMHVLKVERGISLLGLVLLKQSWQPKAYNESIFSS